MRTIFNRDKFFVKSYTVNGDKAAVTIRITAPDLSGLVPEISQQGMTDASGGNYSDQQLQKLIGQINKCPLYTKDVALNMQKEGNKWEVSSNNIDFTSTILGVTAPIIKP